MLGALLVPAFGGLYEWAQPGSIDPWWARLGVAGLFTLLVGISYLWASARRHYAKGLRAVIYVLMGWFVLLTIANRFVGEYALGLLLVYAILPPVVGLGSRTLRPVLWFLGFGFLSTAAGLIWIGTPLTNPLIVLACMITIALTESTVIHGRLAIEKELRAAKEEAEEASQMKSAFLANMSHEIRTPLTSILGFAEVIQDEEPQLENGDNASYHRFAGLIEQSGRRLLDTLDAVLNLAKVEGGEMTLTIEPIDLADQTRSIGQEFGPDAEEASLDIRREIPMEPVWARGDEEALYIVMENLLSNAIKYTEPGGQVELRVRTEGDEAVLEVEDTGVGMKSGKVKEVFQPFRQASEGISREYEGTGLGLAITKGLVEEMGGGIEVDTVEGQGSCFRVRLPRPDPRP